METYSQIEHLKMIQVVIGRLANNSFLLKGWSVTIAAGLLAAAVTDKHVYAWLALFPATVFWGLDGYYLWQERLFRALHSEVAKAASQAAAYSLDTKPYAHEVGSWLWACATPTVAILHGAVMLVAIIVLKAASAR